MSTLLSRLHHLLVGALVALLLGGCTSTPTHPNDPLEPLNRAIFAFNDTFDHVLLKPIAEGYKTVLPEPARTAVGNVFYNVREILDILYAMLEGKMVQGFDHLARVLINSSVGLVGVNDVAKDLGYARHSEDFGLVMAAWGVGSGPYFEIPLFGPSTIRDTFGLAVDAALDPLWNAIDHVPTRNAVTGVRYVHRRAELLDTETVLETAALDRYAFRRDAYLQRRSGIIYRPPTDDQDDVKKPRSETDREPVTETQPAKAEPRAELPAPALAAAL